jgi:hypothetical protein
MSVCELVLEVKQVLVVGVRGWEEVSTFLESEDASF